VLPRHGHGPAPQVAGGRLFIEGLSMLRSIDIYTGRLHYIDGSSMIREFASTDAGYLPLEWQSGQFHLPTYTGFGVVLIDGDQLEEPSDFAAHVYRDGVLHTTVTQMNEPARLKKGMGRRWSIKIEGKIEISRVTLAGDVSEIWS